MSWDDYLTDHDRDVFRAAGYGARATPSGRPAVIVVDVTYAFCGTEPEPILESIETWPDSCGENAWQAIPHIEELLSAARSAGVPIFFTKDVEASMTGGKSSAHLKNTRSADVPASGNEIVLKVGPRMSDIVLPKSSPSAFFGTPLASMLIEKHIETLVVCGATTSGCVRATVVDAFAYNYCIMVAEEACFDRGTVSHWISLFDMDMKYADVVSTAEAASYLAT